jgi:hypothetical protein
MRKRARQAGRVTTFVLAAVAVAAVGGLVLAFMKVVDPEGDQMARLTPGQGSLASGGSNATAGAGRSETGGSGAHGSAGGSTADGRAVIGERVNALANGPTGGREGVFGPDGRLLQERSPDSANRNKLERGEDKGGVGGTGYGAGGKSVLGKYAPPPPPAPEDIPEERKFDKETPRGVEMPKGFANDFGIPDGFLIVSVDGKPATTISQIERIVQNLQTLPNPPEEVVVGLWNPTPGGGQRPAVLKTSDILAGLPR